MIRPPLTIRGFAVTVTLYSAALNLLVALACNAVIGSERQVRQRMAGLHLSEMNLVPVADGVELSLTVTAEGMAEAQLEQAVQRLAAEPGLLRVRWQPFEESSTELVFPDRDEC